MTLKMGVKKLSKDRFIVNSNPKSSTIRPTSEVLLFFLHLFIFFFYGHNPTSPTQVFLEHQEVIHCCLPIHPYSCNSEPQLSHPCCFAKCRALYRVTHMERTSGTNRHLQFLVHPHDLVWSSSFETTVRFLFSGG